MKHKLLIIKLRKILGKEAHKNGKIFRRNESKVGKERKGRNEK